jgi:hypothetical protein
MPQYPVNSTWSIVYRIWPVPIWWPVTCCYSWTTVHAAAVPRVWMYSNPVYGARPTAPGYISIVSFRDLGPLDPFWAITQSSQDAPSKLCLLLIWDWAVAPWLPIMSFLDSTDLASWFSQNTLICFLLLTLNQGHVNHLFVDLFLEFKFS